MSTLLSQVLDDIPIEYRERFEAVAHASEGTRASAVDDITRYVATVRQIAPMVTALDPELAETLGERCVELLRRHENGEEGVLAVAAARYFVEEDDDDEVTGVLGFDDDVQVVNAVCRVLGHLDLVVSPRA
jgi:hypothetical protein